MNPGSDPSSDPGSDPSSDPSYDPGSDPGFILSLSPIIPTKPVDVRSTLTCLFVSARRYPRVRNGSS